LVTFTGRVATGTGDLARWMRTYAGAYRRATGVDLHPGSLNVELDAHWRVPAGQLRLTADEVGVDVTLVACRFMGTEAFAFRTDKAETGGPEEWRTVEILSPLDLRTTFGLRDGDVVELELP